MRKKIFGVLLSAILFFGFGTAGCKGGGLMKGTQMNGTFYNPVNLTGHDPWYYKRGEEYYYVVCETLNEEQTLTITKSKSLTTLFPDFSNPEVTKIVSPVRALGIQQIWAPEMFFFGGHCICCSRRRPSNSRSRTG